MQTTFHGMCDIVMVKRLAQGKVELDTAPLSLAHTHNLRQLRGRGFRLPAGSRKKFGYRAVKAFNALRPETRSLLLGPRFQERVKAELE